MEPRKAAILKALDAFVMQRSGLDWRNYGDGPGYNADRRRMTQQLRDFRALARAVQWRDSLTADDLIAAARHAYSGRLSIAELPGGKIAINYCTGQYFPTEYRAAACAVLASALWEWQRECTIVRGAIAYYPHAGNAQSAGDWLRAKFRAEFGRGIQQRWFN